MSLPKSPSALLAHAKSPDGRKQIRYLSVSVVFVPVGQVLIQLLGSRVFDGDYTKASIVSALILTIPNFLANKFLVWKDTSKDRLRTQVLVFWFAAIAGVTFATGLTWLVEQQFHHASWCSDAAAKALHTSAEVDASCLPTTKEKLAVFAAQLVGFGVVWVARYLILDRWLFKVTHHGQEPGEDDLEMMHGDIPI